MENEFFKNKTEILDSGNIIIYKLNVDVYVVTIYIRMKLGNDVTDPLIIIRV